MLQYVTRYQRTHALAQRARRLPNPRERQVALIHASGPIKQGRSSRGPMGGAMGSDTVAAALRSATADERVRAIVLRVNSPGGSAVASDAIWREVVRARAAGKPVVVSMSDVAASGGYYISMAADLIVAQPGTLTGSIGVIMGKPVLAEALERAGVRTDSVAEGARATMLAPTHPFTQDEWERINAWLDAVYRDFIEKVAAGRRMPVERVHEIARGRVWTGADAAGNGLVDELGGLHEAAELARRRAGLPADAPLRGYPRLTPLDQLRPPESSESPAAAAGLNFGFADGWGPAWRLAAQLGLPPYGPLMLPGTWTIM
jgi:protease IV